MGSKLVGVAGCGGGDSYSRAPPSGKHTWIIYFNTLLHVVLTVGVPVCDVGNRTSNIEMLLLLVVRASGRSWRLLVHSPSQASSMSALSAACNSSRLICAVAWVKHGSMGQSFGWSQWLPSYLYQIYRAAMSPLGTPWCHTLRYWTFWPQEPKQLTDSSTASDFWTEPRLNSS